MADFAETRTVIVEAPDKQVIVEYPPTPTAEIIMSGPQGIQGTQGPPGIQGPAGDLNQATADTRYEKKSQLMSSAAWWIDAGVINAAGTGLKDLTGKGRDALFGVGAAAPTVLPFTGEPYVIQVGSTSNYLASAAVSWTTSVVVELDLDVGGSSTGRNIYAGGGQTCFLLRIIGLTLHYYYQGSTAINTGIVLTPGRQRIKFQGTPTGWQVWINDVSRGTGSHTAPTGSSAFIQPFGTGDTSNPPSIDKFYRATITVDGAASPQWICEPRNRSADFLTVTNTGSAGGSWAIARAATGAKTVVVDRPLLLFAASAGQYAKTATTVPAPTGTVLFVTRHFADTTIQSLARGNLLVGTSAFGLKLLTTASSPVLQTQTFNAVGAATVNLTAGAHYGQCVSGFTITNTVMDGYLDGVKVGTTATAGHQLAGGPMVIGHDTGTTAGEFAACVVWDRILTAAEIAQATQELAGVPHTDQVDPHSEYATDADLVDMRAANDVRYDYRSALLQSALWHIDAGSLSQNGTALRDQTGRGRDAVFGTSTGTIPTPIVLPYTGEKYVYTRCDTANTNYLNATMPVDIPATATLMFDVDIAPGSEGTVAGGGTFYWLYAGVTVGAILVLTANDNVYLRTYNPSSVQEQIAWPVPTGRHVWKFAVTTAGAELFLDGVSQGVKAWPTVRTPGANTISRLLMPGTTLALVPQHKAYWIDLNGTAILDPSKVSSDYQRITNPGTALGVWDIVRYTTGMKITVVDRPLVLFGGGPLAKVVTKFPDTPRLTSMFAIRQHTYNAGGTETIMDTGQSTGGAPGLVIQRRNDGTTLMQVRTAAIAKSYFMPLAESAGQLVLTTRVDGSTPAASDAVAFLSNGVIKAVGTLPVPDWTGLHKNPMIVGGYYNVSDTPLGNGCFEFIGAAVWDRALTNAEVEQAGIDLLGTSLSAQTDIDVATARVEERAISNVRYEPRSSLLKSAYWAVDAGVVTSLPGGGKALKDLTGAGHDAVLSTGTAAPVILPWTGEDYLWLPVIAGVQTNTTGTPPNYGNAAVPTKVTVLRRDDPKLGAQPAAINYAYFNVGVVSSDDRGWHVVQRVSDGHFLSVKWKVGGLVGDAQTLDLGIPTLGLLWRRFIFNAGVVTYEESVDGTAWTLKASVTHLAANSTLANSNVNQLTPNGTISYTPGAGSYAYASVAFDALPPSHIWDIRNRTSYLSIPNTGTAGGIYGSLVRATTGAKLAIVDRPLLSFSAVAGQKAVATLPTDGPNQWTFLMSARTFAGTATDSYFSVGNIGRRGGVSMRSTSATARTFVVYGDTAQSYTADVLTTTSTDGPVVLGGAVTPTSVYDGYGHSDIAVARPIPSTSGWLAGDIIELGCASGSSYSCCEIAAAALWPRALTPAELTQAIQELQDVPHADQVDPHGEPIIRQITAASPDVTAPISLQLLNVAHCYGGVTVTGAMVIKIPSKARTQVTCRFLAEVQSTDPAGCACGFRISQYWSGTTWASIWPPAEIDFGAVSQPGLVYGVRFGTDVDGYPVIVIGDTTSVWGYTTLHLVEATLSYMVGAASQWASGWTITPTASLAGYTFQGMGTQLLRQPKGWETVAALANLPTSGNWEGRRIRVTGGLGLQVMVWNGTAFVVDEISDTGWQTLIPPAGNVTSGTLKIRRKGPDVLWSMDTVIMLAGAGTLALTQNQAVGWRCDAPVLRVGFAARVNSLTMVQTLGINTFAISWLGETNAITGTASSTRPTVGISGVASSTTADAWPTVAPT